MRNGAPHSLVVFGHCPNSFNSCLPHPIRQHSVLGIIISFKTSNSQAGGMKNTCVLHSARHSALFSNPWDANDAYLWFFCMICNNKNHFITIIITWSCIYIWQKCNCRKFTWNNNLSCFVIKWGTYGMVGGYWVLIYPRVNSILAVWH